LLSVRKKGRNYFYALRRDVLQEVLDDLWHLAPAPRPVVDGAVGYAAPSSRHRAERSLASQAASRHERRVRRAAGDDEAVVLTW
jgi:hypothetical protein